MFLTVVPGIFADWNAPRYIVHLTSKDLRAWRNAKRIPLATDRAIDASLIRLPAGGRRMYYSETDQTWTDCGRVFHDQPGEGPVVVGERAWLFYFTHPGRKDKGRGFVRDAS